MQNRLRAVPQSDVPLAPPREPSGIETNRDAHVFASGNKHRIRKLHFAGAFLTIVQRQATKA